MALIIVLDSSPVGLATKRRDDPEAEACRAWVATCSAAGHRIVVPSIAYFEVARELRRARQTASLLRLDEFCSVPGAYLPLTDSALRLALELWAKSRQMGRLTADPKELDCDVLIAAQALDLEPDTQSLVVATQLRAPQHCDGRDSRPEGHAARAVSKVEDGR